MCVIDLGQDLSDLICKLIAEPEERLGVNGIGEIKAHPFFKEIDWKNIRSRPPPFVPKVSYLIIYK